jgi:hypothetical protein
MLKHSASGIFYLTMDRVGLTHLIGEMGMVEKNQPSVGKDAGMLSEVEGYPQGIMEKISQR